MAERITSTDMSLYLPSLEATFDARRMEDANGREQGQGDDSSSEVVLFVSDLGLIKMDRDAQSKCTKTTWLLKPKVVLQASFILDPTKSQNGAASQTK